MDKTLTTKTREALSSVAKGLKEMEENGTVSAYHLRRAMLDMHVAVDLLSRRLTALEDR